jgi:long-subunit acyl-CoA synthetase (AMP-forming)
MSLQFPAVTGESVMFNMLPYSHVLEICQEQLCRNYYLIK